MQCTERSLQIVIEAIRSYLMKRSAITFHLSLVRNHIEVMKRLKLIPSENLLWFILRTDWGKDPLTYCNNG